MEVLKNFPQADPELLQVTSPKDLLPQVTVLVQYFLPINFVCRKPIKQSSMQSIISVIFSLES